MLTLIHKPMTRSGSILWLLEELGVPYETKIVTIKRRRRQRRARCGQSASPWQGAGAAP